jgi:hypothetical protein
MVKLELWNEAKAKRELHQRLKDSKESRQSLERQWKNNELTLFDIVDPFRQQDTERICVNYIMRDIRMIHSQMCANPPAVMIRPTSPDFSDKRAADAADRLVLFAIRQYDLHEIIDLDALNTLTYGTGIVKGVWNPDLGDILSFNEKTNKIEMTGDYEARNVSVWNFFPDAYACTQKDLNFCFERYFLSSEELQVLAPGKKDLINQLCKKQDPSFSLTDSVLPKVEVYQYWEKGLPINGMQGRFCWCTEEGDLLTPVVPNPHRFVAGNNKEFSIARLPYHISTDIDVPNSIWGQSVVSYSSEIQRAINNIDSVMLETAKAHGIPRLILPDGVDIAEDSITNTPWDIIKTTGNRDPKFMDPLPASPLLNNLRERFTNDIMQVDGVNDSLFGQQQREQAAALMQYATQQSNMTRQRLFNKHVKKVEAIYKDYLDIVKQNWTTKRTIKVVGKEKSFLIPDFQGSDIAGGFDLVAEYGRTLSLDPIMRREEILQLMPLFKEANISNSQILSMLRLSDLDRAYDIAKLGEDRQKELFDQMILSGEYVAPEELQAHTQYLEFAYHYVNSAEYKYLDPRSKALINRHIKERETFTKKEAVGEETPSGETPGGEAPGGEAPGGEADFGGILDLIA